MSTVNLLSPRFTAIGDETASLVRIVTDAFLPLSSAPSASPSCVAVAKDRTPRQPMSEMWWLCSAAGNSQRRLRASRSRTTVSINAVAKSGAQ